MIARIKGELLNNPDSIVNILNHFDFYHIELRHNEVRFANSEDGSTTNATSVILKVIGWIAIVSGIIGIFLNNAYSVVAIISGIFVIGFGEIIKLLQSINDKLK